MSRENRSKQINDFIQYWEKDNFNYIEKGNVGLFWTGLLEQVYGMSKASQYIKREKQVPNMDNSINYIDIYIPSTKVLIEQKAPNINLSQKEYRPSFTIYGGKVTPFEQAKTYNDNLPYSQRARWIITCNFKEFWIYDLEKSGTHPTPVIIGLNDLRQYYYKLDFLIDTTQQNVQKETKVSLKASELIDEIYHKFLNQYHKNELTPKILRNINKLCVRLVFCMYADDSGIFGKYNMFQDYMDTFPPQIWNIMLDKLFHTLNTPEDKRNVQDDKNLLDFPFVNGGMFYDSDDTEIPRFTLDMKKLIINKACSFDWSQISPTIFGSLFEGTLNPEERHDSGMHYTSVENIHKVIDPLFLDDLRNELNRIKTRYTSINAIKKHAQSFQNKLSQITFLDPACGSGNFLTETYLSLRKLENEAIKLMYRVDGGYVQTALGLNPNLIKVSIRQFYGIEINDFAVAVSKTAMWIAESQMVQATQNIINQSIDFLPLKDNPNIKEGNALSIEWTSLIKSNDLDYIISNPPFLGDKKSKQQKSDMKRVMKGFRSIGKLDFVSAWYKKSADMMNKSHNIQTALVSTNSITLGQQVSSLWKPLLEKDKFHINFCYQSFDWKNDAKEQAAVSCVIIAFSHINNKNKVIFKNNNGKIEKTISKSNNINPYLKDMDNFFISRRSHPLTQYTSNMINGSKATDDGYLSNYSNEDKETICNKFPYSRKLFKPFIGGNEFLYNKSNWCIWLKGISPNEWNSITPIYNAVRNVKDFRATSEDAATRKCANIPSEFQSIRQPKTNYLLIPQITSLKRKYLPIGFMSKNIIIKNTAFALLNAKSYDFGILSSRLYITWAKFVSGRKGNSSMNFSNSIAHNTFPFLPLTNNAKGKINYSANEILKIRDKYRNNDFSTLYDPNSMPNDLLKAHERNDKIVLKEYGLNSNSTEQDILAKLLELYNKIK